MADDQEALLGAVQALLGPLAQLAVARGLPYQAVDEALRRAYVAAAQDVQAAIAIVQRRLPSDMPAPPSLRKTNPADQPVLYLAVTSSTLPLSKVDEYAQTSIAQRISTLSGEVDHTFNSGTSIRTAITDPVTGQVSLVTGNAARG